MKANPWHERFKAVARSQSRYLYILILLCAFFWALDGRIRGSLDNSHVTIPMVELEIEGLVVLSLAPIVLSLVLLAVLGTFPALKNAYEKMDTSELPWEAHDDTPTAIDFIVYSTSRFSTSGLGLLSYPIVLTLALIEAALLWYRAFDYDIQAEWVARSIALVLMLWCVPRLYRLWIFKIKQMRVRNRAI